MFDQRNELKFVHFYTIFVNGMTLRVMRNIVIL